MLLHSTNQDYLADGSLIPEYVSPAEAVVIKKRAARSHQEEMQEGVLVTQEPHIHVNMIPLTPELSFPVV